LPAGLEKGLEDKARMVGAICRKPCRVRKEVWLDPSRVRVPRRG